MDEKIRCQSCGMPISEEFKNFGINTDGGFNKEYCSICFQNGVFTSSNQTVEEMVQSSIDYMSTNMGFTVEKARELSNQVIPDLKRWKTATK